MSENDFQPEEPKVQLTIYVYRNQANFLRSKFKKNKQKNQFLRFLIGESKQFKQFLKEKKDE